MTDEILSNQVAALKLDSRNCDFLPLRAAPRICHSAFPRSSDQSSAITYRPLNRSRSEVRVLCPHTPAGSSVDKLEFTIRTVSLDDKPKYWALSYVWGDPNDVEPICIEGQVFMATRNLREALKRVRNLMTGETMDLQLWVDSICINQADNFEKCWQVGNMSRIYLSAYVVHVWLGQADHNTTVAMQFIRDIGSPEYGSENPLTEERFAAICEDNINRCLIRTVYAYLDLFRAVEDIFHHRPYWKRAWTFQEFCLGTSIIWCGDSWFSLEVAFNFVRRCRNMAEKARRTTSATATPVVSKFIQCIGDVGDILVERLKASSFVRKIQNDAVDGLNNEEQLAMLLFRTAESHASDPKDKVYSLLGLCSVNITPDYSDRVPVSKVYHDTSKLILAKTRNREILTGMLNFAGLSNQAQGYCIPSWAVEWDTVAKRVVPFKSTSMESNKHFLSTQPALHVSDNELSIQAIVVDELTEIYVPSFRKLGDSNGGELLTFFFNRTSKDIGPFLLRHQPQYRSGISFLTAVLSTLLLGRDVLSNKDYARLFINKSPCQNFQQLARIFLYYLQQWKCFGTFFISFDSFFHVARPSRLDSFESEMERQDIDNTIRKVFGFSNGAISHDELYRACNALILPVDVTNFHNKTPFGFRADKMAALKSKKGYIGAGRAGVAPGDIICVLRDASIPFILRPAGDKFVLVGPCYVEGLMDGEAWEQVQAGENIVRTITLK